MNKEIKHPSINIQCKTSHDVTHKRGSKLRKNMEFLRVCVTLIRVFSASLTGIETCATCQAKSRWLTIPMPLSHFN